MPSVQMATHFCFFFRNQAPDPQLINDGLSPLHSRVASLLSQLSPVTGHLVGSDNLYNSAKFTRYAFIKYGAMLHGVIRSNGRGVPKCVHQDQLVKKDEIEKVRGTIKVAKLKNDKHCNGMVMASFYDNKPVYVITNAAEVIEWVKKERKVYSHSQKRW